MRKLSRTLFKFLIPILVLFCLTTFATADGGVIAGADFNDGAMHWSISTDGVLTITGDGDMPDYTNSTGSPWYNYSDCILRIVVEDGITKIANSSFFHLDKMVSISLHNSVTSL